MVSIRYKALIPMGLLAVVLLAMIGTALYALAEAQRLNRSLAGRYHEIEEVRQIEIGVSKLAGPYISYLESGAPEHRAAAERILDDLGERVDDLRTMAVLNAEERELLDKVDEQLAEIRKHTEQYFTVGLADHHAQMQALHEITGEHFSVLGDMLHDYHDDEIRQVDELAEHAARLQEKFRGAALGAAGLTVALLILAIWFNNQMLVRPIISISKSTAGIAEGNLQQQVAVASNDELGRLSNDINRMAQALQSMYKRMDRLAHTDAITGLLNRRAFEQIAERELDATRRYGRMLGLVMFDIDHFKQINDNYGHAIGDEILKWVARTCVLTLRTSDTCFRIGGEEFVLLLQETSSEQVALVAERCRRILADSPWADADHTIPVTASFGIACAPRDGDTLGTLLKAADTALYTAKRNGRNRVEGRCCAPQSAAG